MNYHPFLPLSFRTGTRSLANRESPALVAARKRHRRACTVFVLLVTLGPAVIAAVFKILSV